jgi:hypothetical protein
MIYHNLEIAGKTISKKTPVTTKEKTPPISKPKDLQYTIDEDN